MKTHYSVAELLALELDGLPKTQKGLDKFLARNGFQYKEIPSRGKGGIRKEYELPNELMALIVLKDIKQELFVAPETASSELSPIVGTQKPAELLNWQREVAENRLFIVRYLQQQINQGGKKTSTIHKFIEQAAEGTLPAEIQEAVRKANAKAGDKRVISRRSVFDWFGSVEIAEQRRVNVISVLAPKERAKKSVPEWAEAFLSIYRRPQKPSLAASLEFLPQYYSGKQPSYAQAYRFIQNLGAIERERGRMGARDLKNIKAFIRQDSSELLPADVYTADGHCFDAEVAHPIHGKPFRPEITAILDVASRKMVGWSVSLSESSWAVLDAIRMCATQHGVPAMFYVDNGSGYKNDLLTAQGRGVLSRLNITVSHALPYNSQGKGLIERSHQTLWVNAAKTLPTYIGKDMDAEASQIVHKITRKDIAEFGESKALISWADFMELAANVVELYNNKPHRGLKRITDSLSMKRRHQSPNEAWAEHGDLPMHIVQDWDAEDMFRPYEERKVMRCEIRLFSNIYFSKQLEEYHNDMVLVGYDIHDAEKVTVRNLDGQFICHALWNANKRSYFPKAVIEQVREKRAQGRLDRLAVKQREVMQEMNPQKVIEHIESQTSVIPFDFAKRQKLMEELEALPMQPKPEEQVYFKNARLPMDTGITTVVENSPIERWMNLDQRILNEEELSEEDENFWNLFQISKKFKQLSLDDETLKTYLERRQVS